MLLEYYKAARQSAALVEEDWYGIVKLTGTERASWLQGMVSNDVQKLKPGNGCYAAHLTPQGKIVAHMVILKDEDCLWLILERAMIPHLIAGFDKLLIMEDVQVSDESDEQQILGLIGPKAQAVLESWLGEKVQGSDTDVLYGHRTMHGHRIIRTDLGYDIWVKRGAADINLRALAELGAVAIDRGTWDVLRTELGWPIFGVDIDETTTLPELGEHGISYDKGCYVGQEVVAKVKYIGHVNRRFVGLIMNGELLPETKSPIRKAEKEVGYVTTSLFSPGLQKPIALGFVARTAYAPGTEVEVLSEGKSISAKIVDLPFPTTSRSGG
jgi:folate-binding protein YgfZ